MNTATQLILTLTAQTPLHAGSGSNDDIIDLPIQRESHTDWPCIFGSSVKGALRARAEQLLGMTRNPLVQEWFGPESSNIGSNNAYAGSLLLSDARLLLLPIRSLNSHFKRVTCPAILKRLKRDLLRLNLSGFDFEVPSVNPNEAILTQAGKLTRLYLEEYNFSVSEIPLSELVAALTTLMGEEYEQELNESLVVVDDDSFRHLCRSATSIQPHIRLNSQTKTVDPGALWYEENLAPETVLYVAVSSQPSRKNPGEVGATEILEHFQQEFLQQTPYIQFGGNETTGMGWCQINTVTEVSK